MSRPAPRRESGFSIIETMVSAALIVVVSALAMKVWDHSLRLVASSEQAMGDASLMPLVAELRKDLHAAASVESASREWTDEALILHTQEGGRVDYQLVEDQITRSQLAPDGNVVSRRRLAFDVSEWSWRTVDAEMVELTVELAVHEEPWLAAQRQSPQERARTIHRRTVVKLALRGRDGGRSW
jgi:Tfp pilus assembly protein PilV